MKRTYRVEYREMKVTVVFVEADTSEEADMKAYARHWRNPHHRYRLPLETIITEVHDLKEGGEDA